MTVRTCAAADCRRVFQARRATARYCSDACRARAWKARTEYRGQCPAGTAGNGRRKPSGPQISYRKAIDSLAIHLTGQADAYGRRQAEDILRPALPARQRERLDAR